MAGLRRVQRLVLVCAVILAGPGAQALTGNRLSTPRLDELVVGRHTFFDFGPPTDYYELFLVRQNAAGAFVQKITLTPPADSCMMPATIETASASLDQSVPELLGTDPCQIPEKELNIERKRSKGGVVFSGAHVTIQVRCGERTRVIRSNILDKDLYDPGPHTPKNTSWTMELLNRLDKAIGQPNVMNKPVFQVPEDNPDSTAKPDAAILQELAAGRYDAVFKDAPDKPSTLYRAARIPPPGVQLLSSVPFKPLNFIVPVYPPMARLARVEGRVAFRVHVDDSGSAEAFMMTSGHPLLRGAVENAVSKWRFPKEAANQTVEVVVEFKRNSLCANSR